MDLGGVRTARGPENYGVLFFEIAAVLKSRLVNIHVTRGHRRSCGSCWPPGMACGSIRASARLKAGRR